MSSTTDWISWSQRNGDHIVNYFIRDKFISILLVGGISLLSKNLFEAVLEAAALIKPSLAPAVRSGFDVPEWIGLALVVVGIFTKAFLGRRKDLAGKADQAIQLFTNFSTMLPAEKQIRFSNLYRTLPLVDEINALLSHPQNPVGVSSLYAEGSRHVAWDGSWFSMRIGGVWHKTKVWGLLLLFCISVFIAAISIIAGVVLVWTKSDSNGPLIGGEYVLAEGILVALAAMAFLKDFSRLAAAKFLVNARPGS